MYTSISPEDTFNIYVFCMERDIFQPVGKTKYIRVDMQ